MALCSHRFDTLFPRYTTSSIAQLATPTYFCTHHIATIFHLNLDIVYITTPASLLSKHHNNTRHCLQTTQLH
ncbi:hypothetical protein COCC4DRAFT_31365 [Bipolaris maydis ATCC 48331]|uniref:Uncharacterized protein n=2 Tax=Cochliobolus heterostrophus TaxID=5016 RepID=M2SQ83_COCH5|nr:uncharacterized protein COCC4DRAFT_31365 [Bipolaris maydis ATCC 48331]EMD87460.1 hypothetical protein COCHEDRAFT_1023560 [Bipolaris maydis C5]ENI06659.1 hypothetical protein COCC4DRAFT_31365 [Bipolaris maydis ATCC 48331]